MNKEERKKELKNKTNMVFGVYVLIFGAMIALGIITWIIFKVLV